MFPHFKLVNNIQAVLCCTSEANQIRYPKPFFWHCSQGLLATLASINDKMWSYFAAQYLQISK